MPTRDTAPVGAPCWIDLFTTEPDTSKAFYGDLLGWTVQDPGPEYGGYVNFLKDDIPVAGCMRNDGSMGTPDAWSVYLAVDDAQATVDAALAHGGQVHVPAMAVMELGTMAVVADPGDASIGIWQPGLHRGFGVLAEPGAPAWFELHTRHYDAVVPFYRQVFGWDAHTMSDSPEFRYTTLGEGEGALAGIMDSSGFLPQGAPAQWAVYFAVESADKALEQIVALGGSVVQAAEDTPYGRIASVLDPTGTAFRIVSDNLG